MDTQSEIGLFKESQISILESWLVLGLPLDGTWKTTRFRTTPLVRPLCSHFILNELNRLDVA